MEPERYLAKTDSYVHRSVGGSDVLISVGANVSRFNGYIQLNPAGKIIWTTLKTPSSIDDLTNALVEAYKIDRETAAADATEFLQELLDNEMVTKI